MPSVQNCSSHNLITFEIVLIANSEFSKYRLLCKTMERFCKFEHHHAHHKRHHGGPHHMRDLDFATHKGHSFGHFDCHRRPHHEMRSESHQFSHRGHQMENRHFGGPHFEGRHLGGRHMEVHRGPHKHGHGHMHHFEGRRLPPHARHYFFEGGHKKPHHEKHGHGCKSQNREFEKCHIRERKSCGF